MSVGSSGHAIEADALASVEGGAMPISPPRPSSASRRGDENAVLEWHSEGFMTIDDKTRIELEAAVFRRLVEHLRSRTDVQNIDMMDLAGFCRNCLASWMMVAAHAKGIPLTRD